MFTEFIICNNIFIPVVWKSENLTEVPVLIFGQKKPKLYWEQLQNTGPYFKVLNRSGSVAC